MFHALNDLIGQHGDGTENQDRGNPHMEMEETIDTKDLDSYLKKLIITATFWPIFVPIKIYRIDPVLKNCK